MSIARDKLDYYGYGFKKVYIITPHRRILTSRSTYEFVRGVVLGYFKYKNNFQLGQVSEKITRSAKVHKKSQTHQSLNPKSQEPGRLLPSIKR
jgi:hypothetical protein